MQRLNAVMTVTMPFIGERHTKKIYSLQLSFDTEHCGKGHSKEQGALTDM
jgi:hypothetical protein